MKPKIKTLATKDLIGLPMRMSLDNDTTLALWQKFMPLQKSITNRLGKDLYCLQVYDTLLKYEAFNPQTEFTKWAAIEVSDYQNVPENLEKFKVVNGLYAVFKYKGLASEFDKISHYIFGEWLPRSEYLLDHRPHFQVMGKKYHNDHPDSEEEVWVPIKPKIL